MSSRNGGGGSILEPTLYIGIGGTGLKAVRTLLLYAADPPAGLATEPFSPELNQMVQKDRIVAMGIDTDSAEFDTTREVSIASYPEAIRQMFEARRLPIRYPPIHHRVVIDRHGMNTAISMARELSRHNRQSENGPTGEDVRTAELISSYLTINEHQYDTLLPPNNRVSQGARQMRALGRIGFLCGMESIIDAVETAKQKLGATGAGEGIRVNIFCSLAGGTGSGMFMDLGILLRKRLMTRANISAYFLLPDAFDGGSQTQRIWSNGYAALQELSTMAAPQYPSPIMYNFRRNGVDDLVAVQQGDESIFDNVYLFGVGPSVSSPSSDGSAVTGNELIESACRSMADAALALNRLDLIEANKAVQNEDTMDAISRAGRSRIYHAAAASYLMPNSVGHLCGMIVGKLADQLSHHIHASKIHDLQSPPHMEDAAHLRRYLREHLEALTSARAISGAVDENKDEKDNAAPTDGRSTLDWRQLRESVPFTYAIEGRVKSRRGAINRLNKELTVQGYLSEIRDYIPEEITEQFIVQLRRIEDRDDEIDQYLSGPGQLTARYRISHALYNTFSEQMQSVEAYLREVDRITVSENSPLPSGRVKQLEGLLRSIDDLIRATDVANSADIIEIAAPKEVFMLRTVLGGYPTLKQAKQNEKAAKYSAGPLYDTTKQLAMNIRDQITNALDMNIANDNITRSQRNAVINGFLNTYFRRTLREKLSASIENAHRVQDKFDDLTQKIRAHKDRFVDLESDIRNENTVFEEAFEPLAKLAQKFQLEADKQTTNEELHEAVQYYMEHFERWCQRRGVNPVGVGGSRNILEQTCRNYTRLQRRTERPALTAIMETCYDQWLAHIVRSSQSGIQVDELTRDINYSFDVLVQQLDALLSFLLDLPEFDLTRLGGEPGVRKTAELAKLSVFDPCNAPGEIHAKYVVVALPKTRELPEGNDTDARRRILENIGNVLDKPALPTADRSPLPVILHENRYHAAYQIKNIAKYHLHYDKVPNDEKPLYHTIREALTFPAPFSGLAVVQTAPAETYWICKEHPSGEVRNSMTNLTCQRCIDEYMTGTRRLWDVNRHKNSQGIEIPGLENAKGSGGPLIVPKELESFFWYGAPYETRVARPDSVNSFRSILSAHDFPDYTDDGMDMSAKKPRHFVFPAVPSNDRQKWVWVERQKTEGADSYGGIGEGPFTLGHENKALYECFHCSFPIDYNPAHPDRPNTCPRCRRDLLHCFYCSDKDLFLFEPIARNKYSAGKECPRCTNLMKAVDHE